MAHPNETLLRKGYDAFGKGDLDTLRQLFATDIVWTVGGRSDLAGTYKGIDEVFGFFAEIVKRSEGTFKIDVHDIVASDSHTLAVQVGTATRGAKHLHAQSVGVFHIKAGKVTEVWFADVDQYAQDEFWA